MAKTIVTQDNIFRNADKDLSALELLTGKSGIFAQDKATIVKRKVERVNAYNENIRNSVALIPNENGKADDTMRVHIFPVEPRANSRNLFRKNGVVSHLPLRFAVRVIQVTPDGLHITTNAYFQCNEDFSIAYTTDGAIASGDYALEQYLDFVKRNKVRNADKAGFGMIPFTQFIKEHTSTVSGIKDVASGSDVTSQDIRKELHIEDDDIIDLD